MLHLFSQSRMVSLEKPQLDAGVDLMARAVAAISGEIRQYFRDPATHSCGQKTHPGGQSKHPDGRVVSHGIYGSRLVVFAGSGNNGADGIFVAAELQRSGVQTDVVLVADPAPRSASHRAVQTARAAGANLWQLADLSGSELKRLCSRADLILDAMLGAGARGLVPTAVSKVAALLADLETPEVWAVDLPSGVGCQNASKSTVPIPARTLCLGALKTQIVIGAHADLVGNIQLLDIGLDHTHATPDAGQLEPGDLTRFMAKPAAASHKYSRGVIDLCVGSPRYPGAAHLAARAALATGVGMVRLRGEHAVTAPVIHAQPETLMLSHSDSLDRSTALVLGSGMDEQYVTAHADAFRDLLAKCAEREIPVVLDASGMSLALEQPAELPRHTVLTPHAGEFMHLARLAGIADAIDLQGNEFTAVSMLARMLGVAVLLKGSRSFLAAPGSWQIPPLVSVPGPAQLAVAGSGDVLSGILGALLAQQAASTSLTDAKFLHTVAAGQLIHTLAARHAVRHAGGRERGGPITASQVAGQVGGVFAEFMKQ